MKKYFQAPWTVRDIILVFLISGLALLGTSLITSFYNIHSYLETSHLKALILFGTFLLQWLIIGIPFYYITKNKKRLSQKSFGLEHVGILHTIGMIIGAYFIFLGITYIITILILYTGIKIPGYQVQEQILPMFGDKTADIIIAGVMIVGLAPVFEEFFFRGFVLRTLVNKIGVWWGSIISAATFALFHLQLESIIPIFILGLIINGMVIRSRSIYPAIFFHILNNAIAFTIEVLLIKDIISIDF